MDKKEWAPPTVEELRAAADKVSSTRATLETAVAVAKAADEAHKAANNARWDAANAHRLARAELLWLVGESEG